MGISPVQFWYVVTNIASGMGLIKCRNMVIPFNYVQSINNMLYLEGSPTLNIRVVWKLTSSFIDDDKSEFIGGENGDF